MNTITVEWGALRAAYTIANDKTHRPALKNVWLCPNQDGETINIQASQGYILWSHRVPGNLSGDVRIPLPTLKQMGKLKPRSKVSISIDFEHNIGAIEHQTWCLTPGVAPFNILLEYASAQKYEGAALFFESSQLALVMTAWKSLGHLSSGVMIEFPTDPSSETPARLQWPEDGVEVLLMPIRDNLHRKIYERIRRKS